MCISISSYFILRDTSIRSRLLGVFCLDGAQRAFGQDGRSLTRLKRNRGTGPGERVSPPALRKQSIRRRPGRSMVVACWGYGPKGRTRSSGLHVLVLLHLLNTWIPGRVRGWIGLSNFRGAHTIRRRSTSPDTGQMRRVPLVLSYVNPCHHGPRWPSHLSENIDQ